MSVDLTYLPLAELVPLPRNPRRAHRVKALRSSHERIGFARPFTVNRRTGHVLSGNGNLKALAAGMRAGQAPPAGIHVDADGAWRVPVLFGDWPAETETEVALALNGGVDGSLEGDLDAQIVADILAEAQDDAQALDALGIDEAEAAQFLADHEASYAEPQIDLGDLERVTVDEALTTVRLRVSEATGRAVRRIIARGVSAEDVLKHGIDHYQTPPDGEAGPAPTAKAGRARLGRQDRAGR